VVDDAPDTRELIQRNLALEGYQVITAQDVPEAIRILEAHPVDLVVTDFKMPGISGLDLVKHVRENYKEMEIVMITGYPSIETAVEAVKSGAEDYLVKPFTDEELFAAIEKALDKLRLKKSSMKGFESESTSSYGLIGESDAIAKVRHAIAKTSQTSATVLINGESGTGKELVARAIHYNSSRASNAFIPVNCGGIPEGLLESELFGHVKGAFTGATESRAGFFQVADGGTIFLDEISETPISMQVKLLRVLQEKEVLMVGADRTRKVDVRIISATNKDLQSLVKKGSFREDLFFRINVISVSMPPLRDRGNDIILLARNFALGYSKDFDKPVPEFSDMVLKVFHGYHWPGNVRELENLIQRLIVMSESKVIEVADLPSFMRFTASGGTGFDRTLEEVESEYIKNVLQSVDGNKSHAAEILGIDRKTLREKLKRLSIEDESNPV